MAMGLTQTQLDCARVIHEFQSELGRDPVLEELRQELGFKSKTSAWHAVRCLEERGWVRRLKHRGGTIELLHTPPMPEEFQSADGGRGLFDVTDAGLAAIADRMVAS